MPNLLQGRTFGIPNVVLIGAAALGIWFFFLRSRSGRPSAGATSPSGQATTDYSLGYAQGLQAAGPPPAPATTSGGCPPDTAFNVGDWRASTAGGAITWEYAPGGQYGTFVRNCVSYSHISSEAAVQQIVSQGGQVYFFPTPGNPIPGNLGSVWQATSLSAGAPGTLPRAGGPVRKFHSGSRSANLWHDGHPLVGAPVQLSHYVRKVGGGAAGGSMHHHHAEVHRVARQAGVHPARVLMLNPRASSRFIRVA